MLMLANDVSEKHFSHLSPALSPADIPKTLRLRWHFIVDFSKHRRLPKSMWSSMMICWCRFFCNSCECSFSFTTADVSHDPFGCYNATQLNMAQYANAGRSHGQCGFAESSHYINNIWHVKTYWCDMEEQVDGARKTGWCDTGEQGDVTRKSKLMGRVKQVAVTQESKLMGTWSR